MTPSKSSFVVRPRFVCGLFVADQKQKRIQSEPKTSFMQGYVHIDLLLLESTRAILKALLAGLISNQDITFKNDDLTDCLEFLEQTKHVFGTPRKDSKRQMMID